MDVDLTLTTEPARVAALLRQRHTITIAPLNRTTLRLGLRLPDHPEPLQLDLSPLHGATITNDLAQRDLRLNALALPLATRAQFLALLPPERPSPASTLSSVTAPDPDPDPATRVSAIPPALLDPLGGLADLQRHILTPASDHAFHDDPGRVIRAARLLGRLRFTASESLLRLAQEAAPLLSHLSPDRLRDEMNALLAQPDAATGLRFLTATAALATLFPQIRPICAIDAIDASAALFDAPHTTPTTATPSLLSLASLAPLRAWYAAPLPDGHPRIVALRWGLLLQSDACASLAQPTTIIPSPITSLPPVTPRLAAPHKTIVRAIGNHLPTAAAILRADTLDERPIRHLFTATGDAGVDVLTAATLCLSTCCAPPATHEATSDIAAINARATAILTLFFTDRQRLMPAPLLTGDDLIHILSVPPGPHIGRLLTQIRHAQLDGAIVTHADALALAQSLMDAPPANASASDPI